MEQQLAGSHDKPAKHIAAVIPVRWGVFHCLGELEEGKRGFSPVLFLGSVKWRI